VTGKSSLDQRRARAARSESLFRVVNERIHEVSPTASYHVFVCECSSNCDERVPLTLEEYEQLRRKSNSFVILPGHGVAEVEVVTEATTRYLIVSKRGAGGELAEQLDPRARADSE
jgi:hypothetical protein